MKLQPFLNLKTQRHIHSTVNTVNDWICIFGWTLLKVVMRNLRLLQPAPQWVPSTLSCGLANSRGYAEGHHVPGPVSGSCVVSHMLSAIMSCHSSGWLTKREAMHEVLLTCQNQQSDYPSLHLFRDMSWLSFFFFLEGGNSFHHHQLTLIQWALQTVSLSLFCPKILLFLREVFISAKGVLSGSGMILFSIKNHSIF